MIHVLLRFKKAAAEKEKNWLIEVPQHINPMTDMYEKKASEKSEKVAKNELQRLKNIARARKVKVPRVGLPVTSDKANAQQVIIKFFLHKAICSKSKTSQLQLYLYCILVFNSIILVLIYK